MAETRFTVETKLRANQRLVRWIIVGGFGVFTELFAEALRHFGAGVRKAEFHVGPEAVLWVVLALAMMVVPIYLISKSAESLVDRKTERIIFVISLLVSAFFLPPLSWFAQLASGH